MKRAWNVAADHVAAAMGELSQASAQLLEQGGSNVEQPPEYYEANRVWLEAEELLRKLRDRAAGRGQP